MIDSSEQNANYPSAIILSYYIERFVYQTTLIISKSINVFENIFLCISRKINFFERQHTFLISYYGTENFLEFRVLIWK